MVSLGYSDTEQGDDADQGRGNGVGSQPERIDRADQNQQHDLALHVNRRQPQMDPVIGPRDAALHLQEREYRQRHA